jgi:hypothetical protein
MKRRFHFWSAVAGGLVAALVVSALPAIAAQVGDPLRLGETNIVNATTALRGNASSNLLLRNTGSGVPLDLKNNGNGKPPLAVDSRKLVKNLNVDKVDFRHANELIRGARALSVEIDEAVFVGGSANILTTGIMAPQPGMLMISASVDASGATDDQYTCQILVDGFVVAGSSRASRVNWAGVSHTDNSQENCATDAVEVVGAGPHVVDFRVFGRNTAAFHSATLWVIWVPYDGDGNVPTP